MTQRTGRLAISPQGNSSLNGLRLAIRGAMNPLIEATNFIRGSGFNRNDPITVIGDDGFLGNVPVFYMTNVAAGQSVRSFDLELGEKSFDWAANSEMARRRTERSESVESKHTPTPVKKRERRISAGMLGAAALVVIVALVILSKKNSDRS